ncbi:zonular occludens toxin domain-containing protein [Aeoliella mucimassa]|uniref:Zonular occludens toxin (Zot) n=1 Tax=Aeoliella mucimassa TaxID=2527972 RepID=A0A518AUD4_9BACT|nr:zonular occludens toxin domain-containing protein [Aeoliella mucimassa]QDU58333.1 Zonular occludens toxin (Zot) [Aeoliella mucimassa]
MFESSWTSFCVVFITGAPGAGKSYCCVYDLFQRLKEHEGPVVTNLPLKVEEFSGAVSKATGRELESVKDQLILIPQTVLANWKEGNSSPAELRESPWLVGLETVKGAVFILDECHLFYPASDPSRKTLWESWLGEVRHEEWAGVYFVSQDQSKVGPAIKIHSELRYELTKADKLRDPWFGIELGLWWEVIASFTGDYWLSVQVVQFRRQMGKMREDGVRLSRLMPFYFDLYESLSATGGGTSSKQAATMLLEHQKRPVFWFEERNGRKWMPTWLWFLRRTWVRVTSRLVLVAVVGWLCFGGGVAYLLDSWMDGSKSMMAANAEEQSVEKVIRLDGEKGTRSFSTVGKESKLSEASAVEFAELLKGLPEAERKTVLDQMSVLRDQVETERARIRAEREAEEEAREKRRRSIRVVAIDGKRVWLSDGSDIREGETIVGGEFDGAKIEKVDTWRRRVTFDDGVMLGMGAPSGLLDSAKPADGGSGSKPAGSSPAIGRTSVSGPLPASSGP